MKPLDARVIFAAAIALAAFATSTAQADDVNAEIRLLKSRLKGMEALLKGLAPLKQRLKHLEAQAAKQNREADQAAAQIGKAGDKPGTGDEASIQAPPPPFLVDLSHGFKIESVDHANSFRIGGRLHFDGGGSSQPEQGYSSYAGLRQARLEVEGKALTYWDYKLQYDFTAKNTASVGAVGGIRDAYIALSYFNPITYQVGQFFEPMGLEGTNSKNFTDFIEKAMATEAFAPGHHIGFAALTHGSAWSIKAGVFTTSLLEKSLAPAASTPIPLGIPSQAGWVATGGSQYVDVTGRAAYAPILSEDRLVHLGVSGRYHLPNDSTAANDRVLALGSNIKTESNILNENLLGTPDLSCGEVSAAGSPPVAGKCVKNVLGYGAEFVAAYGPFSLQSEYLGAHYNRSNISILTANAAGIYAPGGSSLDFNGYYVYGAWYLTGESRAASYKVAGLTPATFGQTNIKNPLSAGGAGAWEFCLRFSAINLNNGPLSGVAFANLLAAAQGSALVANSGVVGGREENLTVGLNWYPEPGFRVMANWTRVMQLTAPWDRAYLNNAHPNTFLMRTQVDW